jgi:hypothetical protein
MPASVAKAQAKSFDGLINRTFRVLARRKSQTETKHDPSVWRTGSAREEARSLFAMLQRNRNGDDIQTLRELISISAREEAELREWAAFSSPTVAVGIENMLCFRAAVLVAFDRLVAQRSIGEFTS